jgi:uncharacterized protein
LIGVILNSSDEKFVVDTMLGKLAKWLRVMGFNAHYQPFFDEARVEHLTKDGFILLSRQRERIDAYSASIHILSDNIGDQLREMKQKKYIPPPRQSWFTRCLICNVVLNRVTAEDASENIPEYIFYQDNAIIRMCPSCKRYFWPGSHKNRMINQLKLWGIIDD